MGLRLHRLPSVARMQLFHPIRPDFMWYPAEEEQTRTEPLFYPCFVRIWQPFLQQKRKSNIALYRTLHSASTPNRSQSSDHPSKMLEIFQGPGLRRGLRFGRDRSSASESKLSLDISPIGVVRAAEILERLVDVTRR